jgi:hypothetical protein
MIVLPNSARGSFRGSFARDAPFHEFNPPSAVTFSTVILPPAGALVALCVALSVPAEFAATRLHFAPNNNFDSNGAYLPAKAGFNLADVSSIRVLDSLLAGVKGLAWVGQCGGVDAAFLETVRPYVGKARTALVAIRARVPAVPDRETR